MLGKGTSAPSFSVKDHNGNDISLADFKGKKVVLWFYPKADTPGCTMEGKGSVMTMKNSPKKIQLS